MSLRLLHHKFKGTLVTVRVSAIDCFSMSKATVMLKRIVSTNVVDPEGSLI